jgi:hypothetical protein
VEEKSNDDSNKLVEKNLPPIWVPITLAAVAYIGALLHQTD